MISIGTVWDRTTDVLRGRAGILAGIAALLVFLPSVLDAVIRAAASGPVGSGVSSIVALVGTILSVWGTLALIAVASDPAVGQRQALAIGSQRLLPAIGLSFVVVVALLIVAIPGIVLAMTSGFDMARAQAGLEQTTLDVGRFGWALLWFALMALLAVWLGARFLPLFPVIVNERRGVGAFARSLALTRGSTMKLVGVLILFLIVMFVVVLAAASVVGLLFRLVAGEGAGTLAAAIVVAAVTSVMSVIQSVFSAQFYRAARDRADGTSLHDVFA